MNDDARYAALAARDRRFDGVFFVGVSTTGIYCRPICPARTPGRARCSFHETAAQAEAAGFRACFRCRPELAPGHAPVDAVDALVEAAAARIAEGALNEGSVDELAAELGVTARHLRRATETRLGVSPVQLAQTRRLALAKQLLQDTALPLTQIAFAAGYRSVRRFNAAFAATMGSAPSRLRRAHADAVASGGSFALRLDYRPPYDWDAILSFLGARAIPGVEHVEGGVYRRVVAIGDPRARGGRVGSIAVRVATDRPALLLEVSSELVPVLMPLVARVRRLFDLDARPDLIARVLGRDPALAEKLAARPGLRLPGAIDGFEAAVRALLGQQVSVAAATTLAGRFAAAFGAPYAGDAALRVRFPSPREVVAAGVDRIAKVGLPGARAAAVHALARAVEAGTLRLDERDLDRFVTTATALPGIGPWTAHYLAMRALHLPDAFPAADLGVLKATGVTPREAEARAEAWRPFRSYAVMHLWCAPKEEVDDAEADGARVAPGGAPARGARSGARGGVPARAGSTPGGAGAHAAPRRDRAAARAVLRGRAPRVRPAARAAR